MEFWDPETKTGARPPLTVWTRPHEYASKTKPSASESGFLLSTSADLGSRLVDQSSQTFVPPPSIRPSPICFVRRSKSSFRVDGGAVALMLGWMSCFPSLPDHGLLSSYRSDKSVRVVRCCRALRAINGLMANSGRNLDEFALHSLRIGGATILAVGGDISERVIQREG